MEVLDLGEGCGCTVHVERGCVVGCVMWEHQGWVGALPVDGWCGGGACVVIRQQVRAKAQQKFSSHLIDEQIQVEPLLGWVDAGMIG